MVTPHQSPSVTASPQGEAFWKQFRTNKLLNLYPRQEIIPTLPDVLLGCLSGGAKPLEESFNGNTIRTRIIEPFNQYYHQGKCTTLPIDLGVPFRRGEAP